MPSNVLLGEVRCQCFISILVVVSHVILYLTSTHQRNPLTEARNPGNLGAYFWPIPRARSDPLEDEDSGRREWPLSGLYDCLSFCPFPCACLPKTMSFVSLYCYFPILTYVGVFLEKKPVLLFSFY